MAEYPVPDPDCNPATGAHVNAQHVPGFYLIDPISGRPAAQNSSNFNLTANSGLHAIPVNQDYVLLPANSLRRFLLISNYSDNENYINFDEPAWDSTNSVGVGIKLTAGAYIKFDLSVPSGEVHAACSKLTGTGNNLYVMEG